MQLCAKASSKKCSVTISPSSSSSRHLGTVSISQTRQPMRPSHWGVTKKEMEEETKKKKNTSTDAFGSSVWNLSVYLATQCQRRAVDDAISGEDEARRAQRAAAQGVAVKGWSASGWLTDWLCRCQAIASYILLCSVLFSRFNSFPAFMFSLRLQPLRCIPRATSICSFWDFGLLLGWVWVQVGLGWVGFAPRLGYHDHDIAQEQQQHVLEKQANNEANLFLFFFFIIMCFFLDVLSCFFSEFCLGLVRFFHVTEATALYYKTLEIFNMNLPFFLVIYNIILTVFCLIVFSDPIIVSPTPGAALSLRDLQDRKNWRKMTTKKHRGAWKCFVRNGIKISLTKCFIWMAKACYTPRSPPRKNMRLSLLLQQNFVFFWKCLEVKEKLTEKTAYNTQLKIFFFS